MHKVTGEKEKPTKVSTGLLNSEYLCPNGVQEENDEKRKPGEVEAW